MTAEPVHPLRHPTDPTGLFRQVLAEHGYTERPGITWDPPGGTPEGERRLGKVEAITRLLSEHDRPDIAFALSKVKDCTMPLFATWLHLYRTHGPAVAAIARLEATEQDDADFAQAVTAEHLGQRTPDWLVIDWKATAPALTEGILRLPLGEHTVAYFSTPASAVRHLI